MLVLSFVLAWFAFAGSRGLEISVLAMTGDYI
jgi:hypothetical protein